MSRRSSIRRGSLAALALASTCMQYADAMPAPINDYGRLEHRSSICSSSGYSGDTDSYKDSYDGTYSACAAACAQQTKCKSFAYGNDKCHLFDVPVDGNFKADSDSPYTFYDISCPKPSSASTPTKNTSTLAARASTTTAKAAGPTTTKQSTVTSSTATKQSTTTKPTTTTTTTTTKKTTTTTTKATTMATSTTTKKATSTSTNSPPSAASGTTSKSSSGFSKDVCTSKTIQDPNSKGCGCTYTESCGGGVASGELIEAGLSSVSYNACIAACDARPSECVGVVYQPFYGECWLYKSAGTNYKDSNAWFAKKTSCSKPCAA